METQNSEGRPRLITAIMPTLNGADTIEEQLRALAAQTYRGPWELVVADNGSTDGTLDLVREWAQRLPEVRIIDVPERKGISYSCNFAARHAKGDFIVYTHQDDVADPQYLEKMAEAAEQYKVVGGRLDESWINDPLVQSWRPTRPEGLDTALRFLPWAVGANVGIWTDVLDELGGWSEGFPYAGDIDLCWRAQLASYGLGFAPDAVMHYRHRPDVESMRRQLFNYAQDEPLLFKTYRHLGVPRSSTWNALKTWAWVLKHLPDRNGSDEARGRWHRVVGYRWGRLRGSLRHRVLYL